MKRAWPLEPGSPGYRSWLCYLLVVWPWARDLLSLRLTLPVYNSDGYATYLIGLFQADRNKKFSGASYSRLPGTWYALDKCYYYCNQLQENKDRLWFTYIYFSFLILDSRVIFQVYFLAQQGRFSKVYFT